jgi:hypothetical protein
LKRKKEDTPSEDKAFVSRTVKIADKLSQILQKDSPDEYISLVALSVVYKAAVLAMCKSYWEYSDKSTDKEKNKAAKRTRVLLKSAFKLLQKTKLEIESDAKMYKIKVNKSKSK